MWEMIGSWVVGKLLDTAFGRAFNRIRRTKLTFSPDQMSLVCSGGKIRKLHLHFTITSTSSLPNIITKLQLRFPEANEGGRLNPLVWDEFFGEIPGTGGFFEVDRG